jgi:hypothetical protein
MKKILGVGVLIIFAIMLSSVDVSAQYGKKKKRRPTTEKTEETEKTNTRSDKTEKVEVRTERGTPLALERFWFGMNIGNPFISNNIFVMGLGPMAAYKFNNIFSAGIIGDINYTLLWRQNGPNENYFDLSAGVFGRAKVLRAFYAHLEYNLTSYDNITTTEPRTNFTSFLMGAGYSSPTFTAWGYEATLLYDATGNIGRFTGRIPIVYRLAVTYNF